MTRRGDTSVNIATGLALGVILAVMLLAGVAVIVAVGGKSANEAERKHDERTTIERTN